MTKSFRDLYYFAHSEELTPLYFNNAGISPLLTSVKEEAQHWLESLHHPQSAFWSSNIFERYHHSHEILARFIDHPKDLCFWVQNCAIGLSMIARGLKLNRGDKIISWDQEYPSVLYSFRDVAQEQGCELIILNSEADLSLKVEKLLNCVDHKTRAIVISHVEYQTGFVNPIQTIANYLKSYPNALLIIDAAQSAGVIPFSMKDSGVDVVVGVGQKWLCSLPGSGFMAYSEKANELIRPTLVGAFTYGNSEQTFDVSKTHASGRQKFENGTPALLECLCLAKAMDTFQHIGINDIYKEALKHKQTLVSGLNELKTFKIFESSLKQKSKLKAETMAESYLESPIVTFLCENLQNTAEHLKKNQVAFGLRGGGIRLSPHAFLTERETKRLLELLSEVPN